MKPRRTWSLAAITRPGATLATVAAAAAAVREKLRRLIPGDMMGPLSLPKPHRSQNRFLAGFGMLALSPSDCAATAEVNGAIPAAALLPIFLSVPAAQPPTPAILASPAEPRRGALVSDAPPGPARPLALSAARDQALSFRVGLPSVNVRVAVGKTAAVVGLPAPLP